MNADRIAGAYRWIEYAVFGRELERCRTDHLAAAVEVRRILILGEGDGRFLAELLRVNSRAIVDVVDSSREMLRLAARRAGSDRVRFLQSYEGLDGPYDLVVTNFFLDCLTGDQARQLIEHFARALEPGGRWIVGEFQERPASGWRRLHAWLWIRVMYSFFRLATGLQVQQIPDYATCLQDQGLRLAATRTRRFGLIASQLWTKP